MLRVGALAALVAVGGCSFAVGATRDREHITRTHVALDIVGASVATVGCILAISAWTSSDNNTASTGEMLMPMLCASAGAAAASATYGAIVRPRNTDEDTGDGDHGIHPNWRAVGAAVGAFATGFARARQSSGFNAPTGEPRQTLPKVCSDDFDCGAGSVCIKRQYEYSGVCAESVNDHGLPNLNLPRLDSVGPKMPSRNDCHFDSQCPIGFTCDIDSGACLRLE